MRKSIIVGLMGLTGAFVCQTGWAVDLETAKDVTVTVGSATAITAGVVSMPKVVLNKAKGHEMDGIDVGLEVDKKMAPWKPVLEAVRTVDGKKVVVSKAVMPKNVFDRLGSTTQFLRKANELGAEKVFAQTKMMGRVIPKALIGIGAAAGIYEATSLSNRLLSPNESAHLGQNEQLKRSAVVSESDKKLAPLEGAHAPTVSDFVNGSKLD